MTVMQQKRGTAAEWASNSTIVLAEGEIGVEYDTGKAKIGNGTSAWSALSYVGGGGTSTNGLPSGGTAGQIVAKVDGTDYNATWIDNYTTDLEVYVKNSTGGTLTKGQVVYISGATGANALISLSKADAEITSSKTLGFLKQTLTTGSSGYVIKSGIITGIDTSAASEGDAVWLSPTTAGGWTTTKPSAPNHMVFLGIVTRAHATVGEINIAVQNGYELEELHNIAISSLADKNLLAYESSTSLWKNKTFSDLGLATLASPTLTGTPLAPTATAGTNTTQIATTAFVSTAVSNLVSSAPSTLDTLNELATALGNDPNFATTVTNSIAGKQPLDGDLTAISALSSTGILKRTGADTWTLISDNSTNWDTAYTDRNKWDGSALSNSGTQATARTSLGLGTMATATATDYLTVSTAGTTYLPLAGGTITGDVLVNNAKAINFYDATPVRTGRLIGSGAVQYIQAGIDATDTAAKLYITRMASASNISDFTVKADASTLTGTLKVNGATTLDTSLTVAGAAAFNGGFSVDSTAFSVADATGNTSIGGTLSVASGKQSAIATSQTSASVANTWGANKVVMTASVASALVPTLRPDGSALQAGDIWISW
jgi:hypothetical protein